MAYRFKRRRGGYRRRSFRKPGQSMAGSALSLASAAYKGFKFIRGLVNVERKFHDTASQVTPPSTGLVINLNGISAGDTSTQRNGNSILAKYLLFDASVIINPDASVRTTYLRCMIFYDASNQGLAPTINDVLTTVSTTSQKNVNNGDRFWILYDKVLALNNNGAQSRQLKFFKKLNMHLKYDGTASNDYEKNSIWLVFISDQLTLTPTVTYSTRLAFYDN